MISTDPARRDFRLVIILAANRHARQPPQYRQLSDMRQRIRQRSLKQFVWRSMEGLRTLQKIIEAFQAFEKPLHFIRPRLLRGMLPRGLTLRDRWDGWTKEPFTSESRQHISVWQKPAR